MIYMRADTEILRFAQNDKFSLDKKTALRYLGFKNTEPEGVMRELLDRAEKRLLAVMRPRYVFRVLDLKDGELAGAPGVLAGKAIREHLEGCSRAVLLAATLSSSIDTLLRQMSVTGMAEAMAVDALASAAVEQVLDLAEESIFRDPTAAGSVYAGSSAISPALDPREPAFAGKASDAAGKTAFAGKACDTAGKTAFAGKASDAAGKNTAGIPCLERTFRFSPGYADFPLEVQPKLLELLDAPRRIGLTVSPGLLLVPTKSVTCVIGVGEHLPMERKKTCKNCTLGGSCSFRRSGTFCFGS